MMFVKKDVYNAKKKNIEDKIPDITNLATKTTLNSKTAEGRVNLSPPVVFRKMYLLKRVKPWFFVTFNIILR